MCENGTIRPFGVFPSFVVFWPFSLKMQCFGSPKRQFRFQNPKASKDAYNISENATRLANPPAPYRAQNQENLEIPFSESKNTLFDPLHGTHLNGRFGAFNFPLLYELLH